VRVRSECGLVLLLLLEPLCVGLVDDDVELAHLARVRVRVRVRVMVSGQWSVVSGQGQG